MKHLVAAFTLSVCLPALLFTGCSRGQPGESTASGAAGAALAPRGQLEPPRLNFPVRGSRSGNVDLEPVFTGLTLTNPIQLTHAPDQSDRIFIVEQAGFIRVFPNDPNVTQARQFIDLTPLTSWGGGETGLLGMAFDPDYANNGYFYVNYTQRNPLRTNISRFTVTADPDVADPTSERVLLTIPQPYENHNGGALAFGPDDMLYIGVGDGGGSGDPHKNGQDLTNLFGTILRIDPHGTDAGNYGIPADNPFVALPAARDEIWAYGLRNPWRMSFDRSNGRLWVADVGQDVKEEIDVIVRGGNYGWKIYEGDEPFENPNNIPPSEFEQPIHVYDHIVGKSVIGGHVYRGNQYPSLRGLYFFADHIGGQVWSLNNSGPTPIVARVAQLPQIASFGEDQNGELYVTTLSGEVRRLKRRVPDPEPPFPLRLSQTGIFSDTANMVPVEGLIEYEVNAPLWSDDAQKQRWYAPSILGGKIDYDPTEAWIYPVGTIFIKHFELSLNVDQPGPTRRLETRVFVHEEGGWAGYTYKWNSAQTDAILLTTRVYEDYVITDSSASGGTRIQTWTYPGRSDCLNCHNTAAGFVLGGRTKQLNRIGVGHGGQNQIALWNDMQLFSSDVQVTPATPAFDDPSDTSRPMISRARAYLDVNCAVCHQPNGPGRGSMDLRHGVPRWQMQVEWWPANFGDLGIPGGVIVWPGSKEASILWERMRRLDSNRMPALGSNRVHTAGVDLIGAYIDSLR